MITEFEVEDLLTIRGRSYILARALKFGATFHVNPGATLKQRSVEPWLTLPRAVDSRGEKRQDLVAFCLKRTEDLSDFTRGEHVFLSEANDES